MPSSRLFGAFGTVAVVLNGCGSGGGGSGGGGSTDANVLSNKKVESAKVTTLNCTTLYNIGTPAPGDEQYFIDETIYQRPGDRYYDKWNLPAPRLHYLRRVLDVQKLYDVIVRVMKTSQECWPADGPQDDDQASYAGLFVRLAWHCSGTLRVIDGKTVGGCEGGRIRHWPEREWRDNANLDQARAVLAQVKIMPEYQQLSWGDLITFAGTVAIKASGGPVHEFCFGRWDDSDGRKSIMLGSEGITQCELGDECVSHAPCKTNFHWPEQDTSDDARCNLTQADGRQQGSHSLGLIYVFPEGPQLRKDQPDYDASQKHQRSQKLGAQEVRDTFKTRMGWTDQETVALIGGGHTLGRAHGNCASNPDPNETCSGKYTTTAGFEGAWTRTPSQWNYDFFEAMLEHEWVATKSPDGNDQWGVKDNGSPFAKTFRLTADLALIADPAYKEWAVKYHEDHELFDNDFANAWFKLTHRSERHPYTSYRIIRDRRNKTARNWSDLERSTNKCTNFDFVPRGAKVQFLSDATDKRATWNVSSHKVAFLGAAGLMAFASLAVVARRQSTASTSEGLEMTDRRIP